MTLTCGTGLSTIPVTVIRSYKHWQNCIQSNESKFFKEGSMVLSNKMVNIRHSLWRDKTGKGLSHMLFASNWIRIIVIPATQMNSNEKMSTSHEMSWSCSCLFRCLSQRIDSNLKFHKLSPSGKLKRKSSAVLKLFSWSDMNQLLDINSLCTIMTSTLK